MDGSFNMDSFTSMCNQNGFTEFTIPSMEQPSLETPQYKE